MAGFGPNEWLVYEMYQQYLKDPESVDKAWWDFFADYQPSEVAATNGAAKAPAPEPTRERAPTTTPAEDDAATAPASTTSAPTPAPVERLRPPAPEPAP